MIIRGGERNNGDEKRKKGNEGEGPQQGNRRAKGQEARTSRSPVSKKEKTEKTK